MSDTIFGYDGQKISTPVEVRRGSSIVIRRQCKVLNRDTWLETPLDISAATAIEWQVVQDLNSGTTYMIRKFLNAGITLVSLGSQGIYDITLTSSATKNVVPGVYKASVAITLSTGFYKFEPYHFVVAAAQVLNE